MDWYDVRVFLDELKFARDFLFEVAANEERLSIDGLRGLKKLSGYEKAMEIFSSIEPKVIACESLARFIDPNIADRIGKINNEGFLLGHATDLAIAVKLATKRRPPATPIGALILSFEFFSRAFGISSQRHIFEDTGTVPIRKMLADLERTIPFVEQLESIYYRRTSNDEEIFKPSNVNIVQVGAFIENAIFHIQSNADIDAGTRAMLEDYLQEAKAELAKDQPTWKKIVGALVIASTILGGIAVAPQAFENVNAAVKYILGTSVEGLGTKPNLGPLSLPNIESA